MSRAEAAPLVTLLLVAVVVVAYLLFGPVVVPLTGPGAGEMLVENGPGTCLIDVPESCEPGDLP